MSSTKVILPDDIISEGLRATQSNPEDVLLQPVPQMGPQQALTVSTNYGMQVQQIRAEEAEAVRVARENIERQSRAFEGAMTGAELIAEGTQELLRKRESDSFIGDLYNLVAQGPKAFFRDELGITERKAKQKIAFGQQLAARSQAAIDYETAVAQEEANIRKAFLNVGSRSIEAAGDVVDAQAKQTDLALRSAEGRRAQERLNFDRAKNAQEQTKEAAANLIASASSVELNDLVGQLESTGQQLFEYADPIQNGATVKIPLGYLREQAKNKALTEAQLKAGVALAAANETDALNTIDRNILNQIPIKTLRQIAASQGQFSVKNPNAEGEPIIKQFDINTVGEILQQREERQPLIDAAISSVTAEEYAAAVQALGPDASIPMPQVVEQTLNRLEFVDTAIDSIVASTRNLGIGDDLDVQATINGLHNDSAEMNTLRNQIIRGQVALTPEISKKLDAGMEKLSSHLLENSEKIAKRFAGGDKDLEAFVTNSLMGRRSSPENAANAFVSLATQPEAGFNADATQATRDAMNRYNEIRSQLYSQALAKKGESIGQIEASQLNSMLAQLNASKGRKEPLLSKDEQRQLDIKALNMAAVKNRNSTRTSILAGDVTVFDPQFQTSLLEHPFTQIENLHTFEKRADQRALAQLQSEKLDPKSKDESIRTKANERWQELYYTNYAQLLLESGAEGFGNGMEAFVDFVNQSAFQQGLQAMSRGARTGAVPDQIASQLFGPRTANGLNQDLNQFIAIGQNVHATAIESQAEVRRAYRNDGLSRLSAVLDAMPNEIIGDQDAAALHSAVRQRVQQMNADGRTPSSRTNQAIENIILHQKFDDPRLEDIRKRVAKEWITATTYADRIYFIDQQAAKKSKR